MKSYKIQTFLGMTLCTLALMISQGWAMYDVKQMTAEVEAAITNRQARFNQLQDMKATGAIGENNRGYVETLAGDAGAAALVSAENADRSTIYKVIVEQNNLGGDGLPIVEKVFGEVQAEKARPGDSIQLASGEWTKK